MLTVIMAGNLIVGPERKVLRDAAVVVKDAKIDAVGDVAEIKKSLKSSEVEVIDASDKSVMPGLIDLHTHLTENWVLDKETHVHQGRLFVPDWAAENLVPDSLRALRTYRNAWDTLMAGITTIRDAGGRNLVDVAVRDAIDMGVLEGPRLQVSGKIISMSSSAGIYCLGMFTRADGSEEIRKAVREQMRAGVDLIKIMAEAGTIESFNSARGIIDFSIKSPGFQVYYSEEELRAAVDETHSVGKRVAAHAVTERAIKTALRADVDTIEHGGYVDDEILGMMLEREVSLVPTLSLYMPILRRSKERPDLMESLFPGKTPETVEAEVREAFQGALEAGVKIGMGTDASTPYNFHGDNAQELEYMVEFGMSPAQAIAASTIIAAEAMGLEDRIGSVEAGKLADILIVDDDPLGDIKILRDQQKVPLVMKGGKPVRSSLPVRRERW